MSAVVKARARWCQVPVDVRLDCHVLAAPKSQVDQGNKTEDTLGDEMMCQLVFEISYPAMSICLKK